MKRLLSLLVCCLSVLSLTTGAWSKPAAESPRGASASPLRARSPIVAPALHSAFVAPRAAEAAQDRADTLFLFAADGPGVFGAPGTDARGYTFDGPGGDCEPAGWVDYDSTLPPGPDWHLEDAHLVDGADTDLSGAMPFDPLDLDNDYAMHCGRWAVCGWNDRDGYGNNWDQRLRLISDNFTSALTLQLSFISDYEGDVWDNFQILIETEIDGDITLEEIYVNDVAHDRTLRDTTFTVLPTDFPAVDSFGDVILRFVSDGAWSDQDGLFISNVGAVWVDNLVLTADGIELIRDDFESGVANPAIIPGLPDGAGSTGALYSNLFAEDPCTINNSCVWAFFDFNTSNPDYPVPVIQYGPPYLNAEIQSPLLTMAHPPGDANGTPLAFGPDTEVNLDFWVYADMPSDALIYYSWAVAVQAADTNCPGYWANNNMVFYGDNKLWGVHHEDQDVTLAVLEAAGGGIVQGIQIALNCVDMCPFWCDSNGSGENHTPGPYFDTVRLALVETPSIAWSARPEHKLQDNFPEAAADGHGGAAGKVRIDPAKSVEQIASPIVVIGDSTMVSLNMDGHGGIRESFSTAAGENRPELWLYFQVVAGPHSGMLDAAMGDPDGSDGCFSPYEGTVADPVSGEPDWGIVRADLAYYQGTPPPNKYAFDFADDYFEAGDVIHYFWSAVADDGYGENHPAWALASALEIREHFTVRCLPTLGTLLLLVDDGNSALPNWREAFYYNGYDYFDIYAVQAPNDGQENGLAGRASETDIAQYHCIIWDSGNVTGHTVETLANGDKTDDGRLLADHLANATQATGLWLMGDRVAGDLGGTSPFLLGTLGATLLPLDYHGATGIVVPRVFATDPLLQYLGDSPSYWVHGGCPDFQHFNRVAVNPALPLASVSHEWEVQLSDEVAGIKNLDPDGNGTEVNDQGFANPVLYQPFSYGHVQDDGYAWSADVDYARRSVGHILDLIFGCIAPFSPVSVPETPAFTQFHGNYPNPFNPSTAFRFSLAEPGRVSLAIYDVSGRRVRQLMEGAMPIGEHEIVWDGRDDKGGRSASGVYFSRFSAGDVLADRKLVMLK